MPGVSSTDHLTEMLQELQTAHETRKTVWGAPVPWNARPVFAWGNVVAPAYGAGTQLIIATYKVPRGYSALICGLVLGYVGTSGAALPGQILYTVDVDSPLPAVTLQAEKDFNNVPFQLGDFVGGPVWPVEFKHDQGETVRIKGQTVAGVSVGAGNFLYGALVGFEWASQGFEQ